MSTYSEQVGTFYDRMGELFQVISEEAIHVGIWPHGEQGTHADAQNRLTDLVIERVCRQPHTHVLDVGCGTGKPTLRLAQATRGQVVGISISPQQVATATHHAEQVQLLDRVSFQHADALHLPFSDHMFDSVVALESFLHIADRPRALQEIGRVLQPGGQLVLTDVIEAASMTEEQRQIMFKAFMIHSLETVHTYPQLITQAGLTVTETLDLSTHIHRSPHHAYKAIRQQRDHLTATYGHEMVATLETMWPQIITIHEQHFGYVILTAQKAML